LHGAYTFAFRAELLRRLPGAAAQREARRERRQVRAAVRDLEAAARDGLLTATGIRLLRRIAASVPPD
jgi:hypothetical protein